MDGQTAQPENPKIIIKTPSNFLNRKIFIYAGVLLLGFSLGLISSSILPFGKLISPPQVAKITPPAPSFKPTIDEAKLPISLSLLTNPMVYEWRGDIKGKITAKDEHTFTLVDEQGHSIIITNKVPSGEIFKTLFYNQTKTEQKPTSLKDIPLGSAMRGDFFIFKDGANTPVGSVFVKE